jgi:glycosyltransferase involved in cell wall biosynthesis
MRTCNYLERRWEITYPLWGPRSLLRLGSAVRRCDVVYLHDCLYMGNVLAYLCGRLLRKPVVITQHIDLLPYPNPVARGLMAAATRLVTCRMLRGCAACVFISTKVQTFFERRVGFRRRPLYIPNGIDGQTFSPRTEGERLHLRSRLGLPEGRPVMLFVGRFVERKGLPLLRGLAEQFPQCHWVFIGRGDNDPSRWGLPHVTCLGMLGQRDIVPYYQAADLLLLPSVGEGFPLVVQEAMACGTPVLISAETARALPGIEAVAYVTAPHPGPLAALLRRVLDAPAALQSRRAPVAAFAREQWPDWEACADRYLQLFAHVAGSGPAGKGPLRRPEARRLGAAGAVR